MILTEAFVKWVSLTSRINSSCIVSDISRRRCTSADAGHLYDKSGGFMPNSKRSAKQIDTKLLTNVYKIFKPFPLFESTALAKSERMNVLFFCAARNIDFCFGPGISWQTVPLLPLAVSFCSFYDDETSIFLFYRQPNIFLCDFIVFEYSEKWKHKSSQKHPRVALQRFWNCERNILTKNGETSIHSNLLNFLIPEVFRNTKASPGKTFRRINDNRSMITVIRSYGTYLDKSLQYHQKWNISILKLSTFAIGNDS